MEIRRVFLKICLRAPSNTDGCLYHVLSKTTLNTFLSGLYSKQQQIRANMFRTKNKYGTLKYVNIIVK